MASDDAAQPDGESALRAVTATSAKDAWAVGSTGAGLRKTLILHWNGRRNVA